MESDGTKFCGRVVINHNWLTICHVSAWGDILLENLTHKRGFNKEGALNRAFTVPVKLRLHVPRRNQEYIFLGCPINLEYWP